MSDLSEPTVVSLIAEVLDAHRLHWGLVHARHECNCGEWCDSGPGMERVERNFREHVAELLASRLNLHEERLAAVLALVDGWMADAGPGSKKDRVFGPQVVSVPFVHRMVHKAAGSDWAEEQQ